MFNFMTDVFQTLLQILQNSWQKSSIVMSAAHVELEKSYNCKTDIGI